ncbi:MAG: hypothetical protein ACKPJD_29420, partial [Planctomycetaceae bacterium]
RPMAVTSGKTGLREGEAPAEPYPSREDCGDPGCFASSPAIAHSADQCSVARQKPRPPGSFPVWSQDSREL